MKRQKRIAVHCVPLGTRRRHTEEYFLLLRAERSRNLFFVDLVALVLLVHESCPAAGQGHESLHDVKFAIDESGASRGRPWSADDLVAVSVLLDPAPRLVLVFEWPLRLLSFPCTDRADSVRPVFC